MRARVVRLAVTSVIALGLILGLWATNRPGGPWVGAALGAGWALMPAVLLLMLRVPKARYALIVPSTLIGVALVEVAVTARSTGWAMLAAGILLGGLLGAWFWFRLLPVPRLLRNPFGPGRWALVAVHVGLTLAGMVLVAASSL